MTPRALKIDGHRLSSVAIASVVRGKEKVVVGASAKLRARASRKFLLERIDSAVTYGVNTGFGPMASRIIGRDQRVELQYNLIRSHAMGMGEPLRAEFVRAALLVRLNTLAKGASGVDSKLLDHLASMINAGIVPIVPEHGAVGTSGDLVQLAHCALTAIGEGECMYRGNRISAESALKTAGMVPYVLGPKEGLALINGTAMMTGIGAVLVRDAERLVRLATRAGALALEVVGGFSDALDEALHDLRPHGGQCEIASEMRALLGSSKLLRDREKFAKKTRQAHDVRHIPESVQEIYSLRCIPQILGPVLSAVRSTERVVDIEMNSATDNPLVDVVRGRLLHGGNFHGDVVSLALDTMKIATVKLTMLLERQINFFLDEHANRAFPPFLNLAKPGLTLALQGLQFVATSTTAQSQTLAFPQYVHSIPTNGGNQDVVSMGTDSALIAARVIEHAYIVLAINLVTLAQAVDVRNIRHKLSTSGRRLYKLVRESIDPIKKDMSISKELNLFTERLRYANTKHL